ncbi:hypothetical protein DFA_04167 [Cavenderia fasciculata]|uniref:IPT/TIG domain-containing protein n=1 Tax=Cavenderia fasciculata TaxID=261658 RepID=F4Q1H0_CACFS|nr:uncharacterized protein DFA_04167 [Cavenderia fasciculata]EGG18671.1 hypothetical protein DFA_04167 [Cavenderia fasciculata]|eukprot:XP_004366575.1 hypothetical protein DFA_04167 [Cavenderia fasciculata]
MMKVLSLFIIVLLILLSVVPRNQGTTFSIVLIQEFDYVIIRSTDNLNFSDNVRVLDTRVVEITNNCTRLLYNDDDNENAKIFVERLRCQLSPNIPSGYITVFNESTRDMAVAYIGLAPIILSITPNQQVASFADQQQNSRSSSNAITIKGQFFENIYPYHISFKSIYTDHIGLEYRPIDQSTIIIDKGFVGIGQVGITLRKVISADLQPLSHTSTVSIGAPIFISSDFNATSGLATIYFLNLCHPDYPNQVLIRFQDSIIFQNVSYDQEKIWFNVGQNETTSLFGPYNIKVGGQLSFIQYLSPITSNNNNNNLQDLITNITLPPIFGGNITLSGKYFKEKDSLGISTWSFYMIDSIGLNITLQPIWSIQNNDNINNNKILVLSIPSGQGSFDLYYQYNSFNFSYQSNVPFKLYYI